MTGGAGRLRDLTDRTLIRRSLKGDAQAFVELIRHHEQPLSALIRRRVGNLHDAEDVLQETLVRAWLLQVARNRCRDFHKSSQRRQEATDSETLTMHLNRLGRAATRTDETRDEVLGALEEVPSTEVIGSNERFSEREAAELFYRKGLTIAEIAERTRSPHGTVKRRLHHAREHLRDALGVRSKRKEK